MDIKRRVNNLVKKYNTRNPYELADYLKLEIRRLLFRYIFMAFMIASFVGSLLQLIVS